MVNIHQINELTQSFQGPQAKGAKPEGSDAFKNALSQALEETESPDMQTSAATAGLGEITSTQAIQIQQPADIVSGSTDKLLGLLDTYASQLENPGVPLKQIAPVLEQINENAGNLLKQTQALGNADADLKDIATQTAMAARTEYVKFQRGDYLS